VSSRWGGGDLPGACLCALGWFLSEKKKPVSCRYRLVVGGGSWGEDVSGGIFSRDRKR
jgi:hypothetical protein